MERIYSSIAVTIGVLVVLGLVGSLIKINTPMPPIATVYVDDQTKIYYAPPYILGKKYPSNLDVSRLHGITAAQAKEANYKADKTCDDMNYFVERTTLSQTIQLKLGLIEAKPSRWNADGSWNW